MYILRLILPYFLTALPSPLFNRYFFSPLHTPCRLQPFNQHEDPCEKNRRLDHQERLESDFSAFTETELQHSKLLK